MKYLKQLLRENPDKLKILLETYNYQKIVIHQNYLSFARDLNGSPKSIVIQLQNNDYLYVTDYPLNLNMDLISYIMKQRNVSFLDVINTIKSILGLQDYSGEQLHSQSVFGGFYNSIKHTKETTLKVYPENILDNYESICNTRFLKDNISLQTQHKFKIGYCTKEETITIPIYDTYGQLIGVKGRINFEETNVSKYYYLVPCNMSYTLYGYSQNYHTLTDGEIWIFESEKSVMQCDSMRIPNAVAIGSSSLSLKQASLIAGLQPKKIVLLHDEGISMETIKKNIKNLQVYLRFLNTRIFYWNSSLGIDIPSKASLSDLGKERLLYGLEHELKEVI